MRLLNRSDPAHELLKPFIQETQELFLNALQQFDKSAECRITPAVDLGFPHDVVRIAGGFPTGALVEWNCDIPILPIDTTVNIDTSSVFYLEDDISEEIEISIFESLKRKMEDSSYLFNFHKGNHFISFCKTEKESKPLLIIHSNEKEFKYQYNGLMPVKGNWFMDDIKTFRKNNRYIRLLVGDKANLFIDIAKMLEEYNIRRHQFIAQLIIEGKTRIIKQVDDHHYYMPNRNSVAIGCFPVKHGSIVPIFSKLGRDIFFFKPEVGGCNEINLLGTDEKILLTPHGWGKTCEENINFTIDFENELFNLSGVEYKIETLISLGKDKRLTIREFSSDPSSPDSLFSQMSSNCPGEIVDRVHQLCSFSQYGFNRHYNGN